MVSYKFKMWKTFNFFLDSFALFFFNHSINLLLLLRVIIELELLSP